jgi:hypothetical protein
MLSATFRRQLTADISLIDIDYAITPLIADISNISDY